MRLMSSSILVLAAAIMITGGSLVPHGDTRVFVQMAGGLVGMAGLAGWLMAYMANDR